MWILVATKVLGARKERANEYKGTKALLKPAHRIDKQQSNWDGVRVEC